MKRPFLCFLLCAVGASLQAQEVWDLRRAVDYAVTNNISVKQADLQTRFSALDYNLNKMSMYPDATFQGNVGYQFGRSENPTTGVYEDNNFLSSGMNLQTSVTLFNWFAKRMAVESARLEHEADKAQVKKAQDDVALNVAVGYLQVLVAKEQVKISTVQVQQTLSQLELTRKKVNAGSLPELNAAELEAQLARDSSTLISSQAQVQQYLLQLKAILNLDAALPFDIASPPIDAIPVESLADLDPARVYQLALVNLPLQKVNDLRLQAALHAVKAARGNMYPTFSAYGGLGTNYVNIGRPVFVEGPKESTRATVLVDGVEYNVMAPRQVESGDEIRIPLGNQFRNNFGQNIGISVSVPIFSGGRLRTNFERSKLQVRQLQLQIEGDNQTLKQDIYKAYTDAVAAIQKFNASKKSVETAEKAYNFAQKRYNLGLVSTYELVNGQNNLLRSKIDMLSAQFDYVFKMKLLEFYKGQGLKL